MNVHSYWRSFEAFLRSRLPLFPNALPMLQATYPQVAAAAVQPTQPDDPRLAAEFQANNQRLVLEFMNMLMNTPAVDQPARRDLEDLLSRYPQLIPIRQLHRTVHQSLLRTGTASGGRVYRLLGYRVNRQRQPWFTCYDWSSPVPQELTQQQLQRDVPRLLAAIDEALMGEMMYALFPHRARTVDGLPTGRMSRLGS